MNAFWSDVRYALRTLRTNPGFAAVAIPTLALGIGANTSLFTALNATVSRSRESRGHSRSLDSSGRCSTR